ncbi:MAG: helix-turn-helix domain-containing protein [Bacteroidales bacterium]|nr:helix-turn-helix domain-containing protein [Bacteroidales bacterium]
MKKHAEANIYLADILGRNSDSLSTAIGYSFSCNEIAKNIQDSFLIARSCYSIGEISRKLFMVERANKYFIKSAEIFENLKLEEYLTKAYYGLALNDRENLEYIYKTLRQYEKLGDSAGMGNFLVSIAYISASVVSFEEAVAYYEKAFEIFRKIKNTRGQAHARFNLAGHYHRNGYLEKALNLNEENVKFCLENNDKLFLAYSLKDLANEHNLLGRRDSAYYYYSILDTVSNKLGNRTPYVRYLCGYARLRWFDGKHKEALKYLDKASQEIEKHGVYYFRRKVASYRSKAYAGLGDYENALKFYKRSIHVRDSFFSRTRMDKLTSQQIRYEAEEILSELEMLEKDQALKKAEIKQKKQFASFLGLGMIMVLLLGLYVVSQYRKTRLAYNSLMEKNLKQLDEKKPRHINGINNGLNEKIFREIQESLKKCIRQKVFLQPDISLKKLAKLMKTNSAYLSKFINLKYAKNFTAFINELRIAEAQKLLNKDEFQNYTVEGIAQEVGFKTKSVFNTAFKKNTGVTPSFYFNYLKEKKTKT